MDQDIILKNKILQNEQARQYDNFSTVYASIAADDPAKKFIQYPGALRLLGDITGHNILDIGCGNGTFTRMLASHGARVTGYDPSEKQIEKAREAENKDETGIQYFVGERPDISADYQFDKAVSVMALMYAADLENLCEMFSYIKDKMKASGLFCAVIFNPDYNHFGAKAYNRRFSKQQNSKIQVEFFNEQGQICMSSMHSDFLISDYEYAADKAGFKNIEWVNLEVTPEGKEAMGEQFWELFEMHPAYRGLKIWS